MKEYNAYIDESGDEGIRKGSKFFILTAILVEKEKDLEISKTVDDIKREIEINIKSQLHWNRIKGLPNKIMIMKKIEELDLLIVNIIIDTSKMNILPSKEIYNYFFGYLCERICWIMREKKAIANIYISSRPNLKKDSLIKYLKANSKKHTIDYSKVNDIKILPNKNKKLLQLSDCCCSALGQALKYCDNTHCYYTSILFSKYYHKSKNYLSYGFKYVPGNKKIPKELSTIMNRAIKYQEEKEKEVIIV